MAGIATALERGVFLDGAVQPIAGETLTITNPGTGEPVGRVTKADAAAVDAAVRSAHAAFAAWSRRGYADRGAILRAGSEALRDRVEELIPGLVAEQGKTIREARIELRKAAETLEHYAGLAKEVRAAYVHGLDPGVDGRVLRRPLGVVAAIVP
jgi:acyl-CoA reductase-like NAD-dependent aldehyde dehydrogenase